MQSKIAVYSPRAVRSWQPILGTMAGHSGATGAGLLTPVAAEPLAEGVLDVLGEIRPWRRGCRPPRGRWRRSCSEWNSTSTAISMCTTALGRDRSTPRVLNAETAECLPVAPSLMRSDKNEKLGEKTFVVKGVSV